MNKPILILGLGNPLQGDDGAAGAVIERLSHEPLPGDVECSEGGTPGIGLVNWIEGRRRVILVDAARMGCAPGEIRCFPLAQAELEAGSRSFSLHAAGVGEAVRLVQALHLSLPEIILVGIEPAFVDWRQGLSPEVDAAVPQAVRAVLNLVGADNGE